MALVLDKSLGERLFALSARMPVWTVESKENRAAVERIWEQAADVPAEPGVTLFDPLNAAMEEQLTDVFESIDLHHAWTSLHVYGVVLTPSIRVRLAELGFLDIQTCPDHFVVSR